MPFEGTRDYDELVELDMQAYQAELKLQAETKETEAAMTQMVDDAVSIGPNTFKEFTLANGSVVKLSLYQAYKYNAAEPRYPNERDAVRIVLRELGATALDIALNREPSGDFTTAYFDHVAGKWGRTHDGGAHFTPREVTQGQVPGFSYAADVLHEISAQIQAEQTVVA